MILYKVVNKKDRKSAIVGKLKHYSLTYNKGKTVSAKEGTLGIFCFKTKRDAIRFCRTGLIILKVKPIGKKIPVNKISYSVLTSRKLKTFYNELKKKQSNLLMSSPPLGTVCYSKVKVLT